MANFIVGLPGEDEKRMQKTLDFSLELCTSGWNMYAAMALPGSELFKLALEQSRELPTTYTGYSFHSEDTLPLSTDSLSASQILEFRDKAFATYHSNNKFLERVERLYGPEAVENIKEISKVTLKRSILETK